MIQGQKICLREPQEQDFSFLAQLRNNVSLQLQLMTVPRPNTIGRIREWLTQVNAQPDSMLLMIAEKDKALGYVQLKQIDFIHGTSEMGICLAEIAQGRGVGAEALNLLFDHIRAVFGIRKVTLKVLSNNSRAIRLYQKIDFRSVGVLKDHLYQNDEFHDVLIMEKMLMVGSRREYSKVEQSK